MSSKSKKLKECPQCGSNYLDIEQTGDDGELLITCGECNYKYKAFGRPAKKHEQVKKED